MSILRHLALATAAAALLAAPAAFAATDGNLDTTSTGVSDMSVTVPASVKITGVHALDFSTINAANLDQDLVDHDDVCVYSNTGRYQVTATGDGTTTPFSMTNGSTELVYSVRFNDAIGGGGQSAPASGDIITTPFTGNSAAVDCGGTDNASFEVTIAGDVLQAAPAGTYNGNLTLLVTSATE